MEKVIEVKNLKTMFGTKVIHEGLDLDVIKGEILGIVGGSGAGKSVLLNTILGLRKPKSGTIHMLGVDMVKAQYAAKEKLKAKVGVLFQDGALFSSLTIGENIAVPLKKHLKLPKNIMESLLGLKVNMVGLEGDVLQKYPSELSGGMKKRAGLARALALDPSIVFLDEPTAGLDAISAYKFDDLILSLNKSLGLTVVMITHDLDTLFSICDRVAVLVDHKMITLPTQKIIEVDHPWIQAYFNGERGKKSRYFLEQRLNLSNEMKKHGK